MTQASLHWLPKPAAWPACSLPNLREIKAPHDRSFSTWKSKPSGTASSGLHATPCQITQLVWDSLEAWDTKSTNASLDISCLALNRRLRRCSRTRSWSKRTQKKKKKMMMLSTMRMSIRHGCLLIYVQLC